MNVPADRRSANGNRAIRYLYGFTILCLTLSGFGQMPVFKRYYIADIPGLGWLARFYITHYIHYLGAILFLTLMAYLVVGFLIRKKNKLRLTAWGYLRGAILFGIMVSGVMLVIRNLEGNRFSPELIIWMDMTHLGLVIIFLMIAGFCLATGKSWVVFR